MQRNNTLQRNITMQRNVTLRSAIRRACVMIMPRRQDPTRRDAPGPDAVLLLYSNNAMR